MCSVSLSVFSSIADAQAPAMVDADGAVSSPRSDAQTIAIAGADELVSSPGSSNSVAAGVWNPAAWPMLGRGGMQLAWTRFDEASKFHDFRGVMSFGHLGFSMRRQSFEGKDHYDYTTGFGWGNRANSTGLSYSWTRGSQFFGESRQVILGSIHRWRPLSLGMVRTWERERGDDLFQADLGVRVLGPRWTLFADAEKFDGEDWDETRFGFGTEVQIHEGVSAALRAEDDGQVSLRLELALPGTRVSYRHHMDEDRYQASTYAVEGRSGPDLSYLFERGERFPTVDLRGPLAYRTYRYFDDRTRLIDLLARLDTYANDPRVGGVVVQTSGLRMSAASLWEVRAQLEGLRAKGKKVIVYLDRMTLFSYSLATVADDVWMDPAGSLDLRGLSFGKTYYRRLLEKMGIGMEEWRYFTYKSAAESLSRTSMSDADREQMEAIIGDLYEEVVEQIVRSRGLNRTTWDTLVDERGVFLADEAMDLGLVDHLGSFADAESSVHESNELGGSNRVRKPVSKDAITPLGTIQGDPIWSTEEWGEPEQIGILYAIGVCAMDSGIKGRQLSKSMKRMGDNPKIKAIVLRVDSPGGDPLPSDLVAREVLAAREKKPVIISQGQLAASGGYWVSMYGTRILASPVSITGSIGVISMNIWDDGIGEKVGMDFDHVQRGSSADLASGPSIPLVGAIPHRPLTDGEKVRAEEVIRALYRDFVHQVAEGRSMTDEGVDEIAQGRVWSGRAGLENNLVDEMGGLWRAIAMAKEDAGIPANRAVQFVEGPGLGAFDSGQFLPSIPGLSFLAGAANLVKEADSIFLFSPSHTELRSASMLSPLPGWGLGDSEWMHWGRSRGLSLSESLYLQGGISSAGRPMLLSAPFSLSGVTDVR